MVMLLASEPIRGKMSVYFEGFDIQRTYSKAL